MDFILIRGRRSLSGKIRISGAKNAALPLLATSLLTEDCLSLTNLPLLADIFTMQELLASLGVKMAYEAPHRLALSGGAQNTLASYEIVRKMRASVLVLGPLLAKFGQADVSLPGGCAIGSRPIDLHLNALEQMGARIQLNNGYVQAQTDGRLKGCRITFPFVSVGATENIVMAATLAEGVTEIINAAKEPEITDLCRCLVKMGAKIGGIGTERLLIEGVKTLHGAEHRIPADRIEAGSYACATAAAGGDIFLEEARFNDMEAFLHSLESTGAEIIREETGIRIRRFGRLKAANVTTEPYPGFPTDMQAQFMATVCQAEGASLITENIFENRFMHVPELVRMGADITIEGSSAIVQGVPGLSGAEVMATDLRASVSLIIAALAAKGESLIGGIHHLDRGYEAPEQKLLACGADIQRIKRPAADHKICSEQTGYSLPC